MRTAKASSSFLLSLAAASFPFTGVLMSDTGPGGLTSALAFTAHPLAAPFPEGDVVLMDANGDVSDILRFNPEENPGPGAPQLIFFYSNDHRGLLADTGLPSSMYEQHGHYSGEPDPVQPSIPQLKASQAFLPIRLWEIASAYFRHRTQAQRC